MQGELNIQSDTWIFPLTTRADRIGRRADGSFAIVDYKAGSTPTEPQVRTGLSPQLTLEGAILRPEEHDSFFQPAVRETKASLFEHVALALDASLANGGHGLPTNGSDHWHERIARGGQVGKGESLWSA